MCRLLFQKEAYIVGAQFPSLLRDSDSVTPVKGELCSGKLEEEMAGRLSLMRKSDPTDRTPHSSSQNPWRLRSRFPWGWEDGARQPGP